MERQENLKKFPDNKKGKRIRVREYDAGGKLVRSRIHTIAFADHYAEQRYTTYGTKYREDCKRRSRDYIILSDKQAKDLFDGKRVDEHTEGCPRKYVYQLLQ